MASFKLSILIRRPFHRSPVWVLSTSIQRIRIYCVCMPTTTKSRRCWNWKHRNSLNRSTHSSCVAINWKRFRCTFCRILWTKHPKDVNCISKAINCIAIAMQRNRWNCGWLLVANTSPTTKKSHVTICHRMSTNYPKWNCVNRRTIGPITFTIWSRWRCCCWSRWSWKSHTIIRYSRMLDICRGRRAKCRNCRAIVCAKRDNYYVIMWGRGSERILCWTRPAQTWHESFDANCTNIYHLNK